MKQLTEIFKYYLGNTEEAPAFPDEQALARYVNFAKQQSILGFLLNAVNALPDENAALLKENTTFTNLVASAFKIETKNHHINSKLQEVVGVYKEQGLRSCLLKGQGLCQYYKHPLQRSPGDIDLWVEGSRKEILNFTKSKYTVDEVVYHHLHAQIFKDPDVEIHFIPSWMFCPLTNWRLQRFFKKEAEKQFSNWNETLQCAVTTPTFNAVFLLVHTYRHLFDEGISLKQLLDYYYTLLQLNDTERKETVKTLKRLHMMHFTRATMAVLQRIFGLKKEWMLTEPDIQAGKLIFDEILKPSQILPLPGETFWQYNWRRAKHRNKLLKNYPEEVLWAPVFKAVQLVWRKMNGYKNL